MSSPTESLDLATPRLSAGEGRRLDLEVAIDPLELGGETYSVSAPDAAALIPLRLEISKLGGRGYALRITFAAALHGSCMRCLDTIPDPGVGFDVDAREVSQPDLEPIEGLDEPEPRHVREELESPYVNRDERLDVAGWAHDALVLALPATLLCKPDCLGLCPECGVNLNTAGPEHVHASSADPRWAALSDLKFEG